MTTRDEPLPPYLEEPSRLGQEISVTGKWIPAQRGLLFRKSAGAKQMRKVLGDIYADAGADNGVLSTEINNAGGQGAVLVHHVFEDAEALVRHFTATGTQHMDSLRQVARPDMHMVRGISVPPAAREAVEATRLPAVFGEHIFGYVKEDYRQPNPATAINVTAKWTCKPGNASGLDELRYWWQRVGTDAHSMEEGLLRFEVYQAIGEDALIIHETFADTGVLKFHLTKGTAKKYKSDIDQVAEAERYFFRGPVSWLIRTYSKFLRLPATYSVLDSRHARPGGNMSDGTTG